MPDGAHGPLTDAQRAFIMRHKGAAGAAAKRYRGIWPQHRMEDLDDAITDGLIRAALSDRPERGSESNWVYQCVRYTIRERYRTLFGTRKRKRALVESRMILYPDMAPDEEKRFSVDSLAGHADSLAQRETLARLLSTLSPWAQECLLAWAQGENFVEWAPAIGRTAMAAQQRKHAAIQELRRLVRERGIRDPRDES